jgi:hypothetical protein
MVRASSSAEGAFRKPRRKGTAMDLVYLGLTVGFFIVSWAFIVACDHLS